MKKAILKKKEVAGLSKMKAADLNQALADHFTEEELAQEFTVRGYQLTEKGKQALKLKSIAKQYCLTAWPF